jgi:hypothetical protein
VLFHLHIEASFGVMRVGQSPGKVEDFILTADRLAWLCLVLAVVTLYLVAQGPQVVVYHKRRWVDLHWLQSNSYSCASAASGLGPH